jgi:hypothetical protein
MNRKPDIDIQKDGRVILRGNAYKKMRLKLKGLLRGVASYAASIVRMAMCII